MDDLDYDKNVDILEWIFSAVGDAASIDLNHSDFEVFMIICAQIVAPPKPWGFPIKIIDFVWPIGYLMAWHLGGLPSRYLPTVLRSSGRLSARLTFRAGSLTMW